MNTMLTNTTAGRLLQLFITLFCVVLINACGGGGGSPGNISGGAALFTTAPADLLISPGQTTTFSISGGVGPYKASSSAGSVIASVSGNQLTISGGGGGGATVVVTDNAGKTVSVNVTIGSGLDLFTTAGASVTVGVGATSTQFTIGGGSLNYSISSSNTAVATVGISGNRFVINGVAGGKAVVSVRDSVGKVVSIDVIVGSPNALFTSAGPDISVAVNDVSNFLVGGGSTPYAVSSNNTSVASATISGTTLTIRGITSGTAIVTVSEATGLSTKITVTVGTPPSALFTTAAATVNLALNETTVYAIGGGVGPYSASSNNTSSVTTTVSGNTLTISGSSRAGSAQVIVTDAAGKAVTIAATVSAAAPLVVLPSKATGNAGDTLTFTVAGGTPGYKVTINNPSIASVAPASVASSTGTFTATLLNAGTTTISIIDAAGQTQNVDLTVTQISPLLRLSPSALEIGEDNNAAIALNVFGGSGSYRAFTSDLIRAPVSIVGSVLTIDAANRCFTANGIAPSPVPGSTYSLTITVVDSLGASATSTLTVKDNSKGGAGCN